LSQWRRAKFEPRKIDSPQPIENKFGTVDYICKTAPCAKLCADSSTGGFSANAFSGNSPTGQTP